MHIMC